MSRKEKFLKSISCFHAELELIAPYSLSYNTLYKFEPFIVKVCDNENNVGWGEQHISPGSSFETRDLGWNFLHNIAEKIIGKNFKDAKMIINYHANKSPVASTAIYTSIEFLQMGENLKNKNEIKRNILSSFNSVKKMDIKLELEEVFKKGYKTIKVKVGKNLKDDLKRINLIQNSINNRGTIRIDANRGYSENDACEFVKNLEPDFIEFFEQPCNANDWEANSNVAKISKIPIMLDEQICSNEDIIRASKIENIKFCKLKLKRFLGLKKLKKAINLANENKLGVVLGDGLGGPINCWMEAIISNNLINIDGEYNGFVKIKKDFNYLKNPLKFNQGKLIIEKNWFPHINEKKLMNLTKNQFTVVHHD